MGVTRGTAGPAWLLPLLVLPLSLPYFAGWVATPWFADGVTGERALVLLAWLVLVALAGTAALRLGDAGRRERLEGFVERNSRRLLTGMAALCFLVFALLAVVAYYRFRYHSDLGLYNQVLWSSVRGDFYHTTLEEKSIGSYYHISPFLGLLLPFYALFQSPATYLVLRSLALALAAVPMFFCARRLTGSALAGLLLAAAFLLHPEIAAQHFTSGYEVVFGAAPFLAAFYFFLDRRPGWFIFFLVLTLSVREDFVPVAFGFAVLALIRRRTLFWVGAPLVLGIAWQAAVLFIFSQTIDHWMFGLYYGHLGATPGEALRTLFNEPMYVLRETWRLHASYLYNLLMPAGLLVPFMGLASIFALPSLAANLALGFDFSAAGGGIAHYSVLIVAALWLGLAGGIGRASRRWDAGRQRLAMAAAVTILVLGAGAAHLWAYQLPLDQAPQAEALRRAIDLVPAGAPVATNDGRVIPALSGRPQIYEPLIWEMPTGPDRLPQGMGELQQAHYVILKPFGGNQLFDDEKAFSFIGEPGSPWQLVFEQDGIRVFQWQAEPCPWQWEGE